MEWEGGGIVVCRKAFGDAETDEWMEMEMNGRTRAEHCTPLARTASITASTFFRRARTFALRVTESFQGDFLHHEHERVSQSVSQLLKLSLWTAKVIWGDANLPEKTTARDERWSERAEHGCM